jgi:hypothetical protein
MFRSSKLGRFEVSRVAVIFLTYSKAVRNLDIFLRRITIRPMRVADYNLPMPSARERGK